MNGPYHSFGTRAEEPSLFKVANRQHVKNAVEVCEYNVAANLYEMRAGKPWRAGNSDTGADAINAWMPEEGVTPEDGEGADGSGAWEGRDGDVFDDAWRRLRVIVVGPENFEKNFASRAKHAALDVIVVGAWSAQRVTPALGATAKPGATLAVEAAHISSPWTPGPAVRREGGEPRRRRGVRARPDVRARGDARTRARTRPGRGSGREENPRARDGTGRRPRVDDAFSVLRQRRDAEA